MTLPSLNTARNAGLALVASLADNRDNGDALANTQSSGLANIAASLEAAENAAVPNVLAYGAARAIRQFAMNVEAASLDKADKAAIGWKDLPSTSPAKRRLSQYHSRFRRIAEEWASVPQTERDEMFIGKRSFLTVYDGIVKREKEATAKADAEQAEAEAEAAIEAAKAEGKAEAEAEGAPPSSLLASLEAAIAAYPLADATERELSGELLATLAEMFNSDAELTDVETEQAEAA